MTATVLLETTRSGRTALWESGGGMTNTGRATIIAGPKGERLRPYYIRRRGHLAGGHHALMPIFPGHFIINAHHHRGDFEISVLRVTAIGERNGSLYAEVEQVTDFSKGEWLKDPAEIAPHLPEAIEAAKKKALSYHCRTPYYIKEE